MVFAALMASTAATSVDPFWWYMTRTFAIGSYVSLTIAVVLGLTRSLARTNGERVSWLIEELHIVVSVLTGVLVLGHLTTLLIDPFIPFQISNFFIPLSQPYSTFAVDLGVLSFYGMGALLLSSWAKRRIPYGLWRTIHYVSFATFILVTIHGWVAGSDSVANWMPAVYFGSSAAVGTLVAMRAFTDPHQRYRGVAEPESIPSSLVVAMIIGGISAFAMLLIENVFFTSAGSTAVQTGAILPFILRVW